MTPNYLADTHVVVRWYAEPRKLSREQTRVLDQATSRREPVAISAATLVEIAILLNDGRHRIKAKTEDLLSELEADPLFLIFPITIPIAVAAGALSLLRDPADRTIVATARVHRLRLLTSDQRIIASNLVPVVD